MSLPPDARETLLTSDPEQVLQAILKAYPDRAEEILKAVSQLGLERAIQVILGQPQEEPMPGSAPLPQQQPAEATPQVGKAARGISDALGDISPNARPINMGAGAAPQLGVTPSNINTPDTTDLIKPANIPIAPRPGTGGPPGGVSTQALPNQMPADTAQINTVPVQNAEPPPQESYDQFVKNLQKISAANKISLPVLLAIIKKESQFNPKAEGADGEIGLMQLMPGAARQVGLKVSTQTDDRFNPRLNIKGGLEYLQWIQRNHKPVTLDALLGGYNAGPSRMKDNRWKKIRSTVDYVETIKSFIKTYEKDPETMLEDLKKLHAVSGG